MWGGNGVYRARVVGNQVSRNFQFPFLFPYFPILSHFIFPAVISFLFFRASPVGCGNYFALVRQNRLNLFDR